MVIVDSHISFNNTSNTRCYLLLPTVGKQVKYKPKKSVYTNALFSFPMENHTLLYILVIVEIRNKGGAPKNKTVGDP